MSDSIFRVVIAGDNAYPRIERSFGSLTHLALKAPKVALIPVDSMTWIVIRAFAGDNYRRVTAVWAPEVTFRLLLLFLLPSEHHSPFNGYGAVVGVSGNARGYRQSRTVSHLA